MSIVARGMGLGAGAVLVTAGLGLVITAAPPSSPGGGYDGPGAPPQSLRQPLSRQAMREEEEIMALIAATMPFLNR